MQVDDDCVLVPLNAKQIETIYEALRYTKNTDYGDSEYQQHLNDVYDMFKEMLTYGN